MHQKYESSQYNKSVPNTTSLFSIQQVRPQYNKSVPNATSTFPIIQVCSQIQVCSNLMQRFYSKYKTYVPNTYKDSFPIQQVCSQYSKSVPNTTSLFPIQQVCSQYNKSVLSTRNLFPIQVSSQYNKSVLNTSLFSIQQVCSQYKSVPNTTSLFQIQLTRLFQMQHVFQIRFLLQIWRAYPQYNKYISTTTSICSQYECMFQIRVCSNLKYESRWISIL